MMTSFPLALDRLTLMRLLAAAPALSEGFCKFRSELSQTEMALEARAAEKRKELDLIVAQLETCKRARTIAWSGLPSDGSQASMVSAQDSAGDARAPDAAEEPAIMIEAAPLNPGS